MAVPDEDELLRSVRQCVGARRPGRGRTPTPDPAGWRGRGRRLSARRSGRAAPDKRAPPGSTPWPSSGRSQPRRGRSRRGRAARGRRGHGFLSGTRPPARRRARSSGSGADRSRPGRRGTRARRASRRRPPQHRLERMQIPVNVRENRHPHRANVAKGAAVLALAGAVGRLGSAALADGGPAASTCRNSIPATTSRPTRSSGSPTTGASRAFFCSRRSPSRSPCSPSWSGRPAGSSDRLAGARARPHPHRASSSGVAVALLALAGRAPARRRLALVEAPLRTLRAGLRRLAPRPGRLARRPGRARRDRGRRRDVARREARRQLVARRRPGARRDGGRLRARAAARRAAALQPLRAASRPGARGAYPGARARRRGERRQGARRRRQPAHDNGERLRGRDRADAAGRSLRHDARRPLHARERSSRSRRTSSRTWAGATCGRV